MPQPLAPLWTAAALVTLLASPAGALSEETRPWLPGRHPGAALEDEPFVPAGWRAGAVITAPYALGGSLAYLWPVGHGAMKLGAQWTPLTDRAGDWSAFGDWS